MLNEQEEKNENNQMLTASPAEFARMLGVYKSTVTRAIREKRLRKSLVQEGDRTRIIVYEGCIEWYLKKQLSKDHKTKKPEEVEKSRARREYYKSLLTQLEYEVRTQQLVDVEEVAGKGAEICYGARKFLEDRREKDALAFLQIKDNPDKIRELIRERDDGFLLHLSQLKTVASQVLKENKTATSRNTDEV